MDEIKSLQDKYAKVTVTQLEDVINQCRKHIHEVKQEKKQLLKENEAKLEELISELKTIKENLHSEQQILEQKNEELLKHNDFLAELMAKNSKFIEENLNLEAEGNCLKTIKPNQYDQVLLQQGKEKLLLYRELTGMHWDYSALNESIEGYVSNNMDYIHHFRFIKNEKDPDELADLLWKEIYSSVEHMVNEDT